MKQRIVAIRQLTRDHPVDPLTVVFGILLAAGAAKSGHGTWAIGGMLVFYPIYLMSFVTGAALLARMSRLRPTR